MSRANAIRILIGCVVIVSPLKNLRRLGTFMRKGGDLSSEVAPRVRMELPVTFEVVHAKNPLKGFEISRVLSSTHINVGVNERAEFSR